MSVETKNKIGLIGFIIFFLCAGSYAVWAYWPRHPQNGNFRGDGPRRVATTANATQPADEVDRQARFQERQAAFQKQMDDYVRASPADRLKIVDAYIDEQLVRQQERQDRQAAEGAAAATQAATQPATTDPASANGVAGGAGTGGGAANGAATGGPRGPRNPTARMANRILNGNPQQQAARAQFMQDVHARMAQRNISPPSGGGRG